MNCGNDCVEPDGFSSEGKGLFGLWCKRGECAGYFLCRPVQLLF